LKFDEAALVEPFAIALHAVNRAGLHSLKHHPQNVAIIGTGMIGLATVQAIRSALSGCRIIAVDVSAERLDLAKKVGASHVIESSKTDPAKALNDFTGGNGVDVSFEAVGINPTVSLALNCARRGGSVVLVGNVAPKIEFPLQIAVTRELSIYGSCASRGEYPQCLELLSRGQLQAAPLISTTRPLAEGAEWFDRLYRKDPGLIKVVLRPNKEGM
jgi:L-iditol 2-dehydrogenase